MNEMLNRRLTLMGMALVGISVVLFARLLSFQFYMDPNTKKTAKTGCFKKSNCVLRAA